MKKSPQELSKTYDTEMIIPRVLFTLIHVN